MAAGGGAHGFPALAANGPGGRLCNWRHPGKSTAALSLSPRGVKSLFEVVPLFACLSAEALTS